jgi:cysteine desulfurase
MGGMSSGDRIWLDSASTTPLAPEAAEAMAPWLQAGAGANPSSLHAEGREARRAIEDVRDRMAGHFAVPPGQIHFTGSATEALNLALAGALRALPAGDRPHRVVCSTMEHDAVRRCLMALEREGIAEVAWVGARGDGVVDLDSAGEAMSHPAAAAALMHVNNETGVIQPLAPWAERARSTSPEIILLCDAVQAVARLPLDLDSADLLAISAHKFHGPAGIGALIRRRPVPLEPLIHGGGQEGGLRPGTESTALIVGLGAALERALADRESSAQSLVSLTEEFLGELERSRIASLVIGQRAPRAPGIVGVTLL